MPILAYLAIGVVAGVGYWLAFERKPLVNAPPPPPPTPQPGPVAPPPPAPKPGPGPKPPSEAAQCAVLRQNVVVGKNLMATQPVGSPGYIEASNMVFNSTMELAKLGCKP